jgi:8-oxo-dGTP pyrophosphatase MutT (NUDIX family)
MKKSRVSIILFYDDEGNVILQDREKISKHGESYGFFGGHSEGDETKEETMERELSEELNLFLKDLEEFRFFKHFHLKIYELGVEIDRDVFLAKMPKKIENLKVDEGKIAVMKFKDSFKLKMVPGDVDILKEIYKELNRKIN